MGDGEGRLVGVHVGFRVGVFVGFAVGTLDGIAVGAGDGSPVGSEDCTKKQIQNEVMKCIYYRAIYCMADINFP